MSPDPAPSRLAAAPDLYGAVDLGSHTIRVLVAARDADGTFRPWHHERHVTRLAQGFSRQGSLTDEAVARAVTVVRQVAARLQAFPLRALRCGATGVVRKAANGADFIERVRDATGWQVSILSEEEEALLSLRGMVSVLEPPKGPLVCFDLGGSSTEFSLVDWQTRSPLWVGSVFVGAATLTEAFLGDAPVSAERLREAADHARRILRPAVDAICASLQERSPSGEKPTLAGTAGTVTTLAAMDARMAHYVPYRINNRILTKTWVAETVRSLGAKSLEARRQIVGLEPGREDIILGGAVIVEQILESFHVPHLRVTDAGLLEGLLLDGARAADSKTTPLEPTWRFSPQLEETR
jgi:exopolyphosphatase/guanosine-5'-triphosphate,3'-diphosphate pyrophosphatase